MRFRQGPLTEASIIYLVASVLSFVLLLAANGFDAGTTFGAYTVEAMVALLPSWALWALVGLLTKNKSINVRFASQAIIALVISSLGLVLVKQLIDSTGDPNSAQAMQILYFMMATYFVSTIVAAIFTNYYVLRRIQAGEPIFSKTKKGGKK